MFSDAIAKEFSLSPILIGLTIVAFGTSAPELVITLIASFKDIPVTDAIIGNVIGSNVANLILILGVSALFFKIDLGKIKNATNAYLFFITFYFAFIFFIDTSFRFIFSIGFFIFLISFVYYLKNYQSEITDEDESNHEEDFQRSIYIKLILTFIGIFIGGTLFLDNSLDLFKYLGLQETVIGVSVLAIGTSLPELATVIIAYLKKKGAIGIGNVIGSNIMNILFVFLPGLLIVQSRGLTFNIPENSILHIFVLMLSTITVILLSLFKIKIGKFVALIFTGSYATYIWYII
jgi:cation:H+ antiporter